MVLTVYELVQGEATLSQGGCAVLFLDNWLPANRPEWHGMDQDVMMKTLNVLVKRGKAQVFGSEGQEGVKFF